MWLFRGGGRENGDNSNFSKVGKAIQKLFGSDPVKKLLDEVQSGNLENVESLLSIGVSPIKKLNHNTPYGTKMNALELACHTGDKEIFEWILKYFDLSKLDSLDQDEYNWTLIMWTCGFNALKDHNYIFKRLVSLKVDIDALDKTQCNCLFWSFWSGRSQISNMLFKRGVNVTTSSLVKCLDLMFTMEYAPSLIIFTKILLETLENNTLTQVQHSQLAYTLVTQYHARMTTKINDMPSKHEYVKFCLTYFKCDLPTIPILPEQKRIEMIVCLG